MKAQSNNVNNIVLQGRRLKVSFNSSKFRGWNFYKGEDIIPRNLYPRIKVILISRLRRICNFIGKYRLNMKDGGNSILVDYWK